MKVAKRRQRGRRSRRRPLAASLAFLVSGVCIATLITAAIVFVSEYERASHVKPSPNAEFSVYDPDGFPSVDWEYWQAVNPRVIGWVTIPGTPVDYPIVQAPPEDPGFYLTHDVYDEWNFAGCPYLDADCAAEGMQGSRNAVVFGHNLGCGDTTLFASFAHYVEPEYAQNHATILVQTPSSKTVCHVQGASCIQGEQASKRVRFTDDSDFHSWFAERLEECTYRSAPETSVDRIVTFCTCSYHRWSDERTLVYAAPDAKPQI